MAEHRHKRETNARRFPRAAVVAAPLAVLATLSTVSLGILGQGAAPTAAVYPTVAALALRHGHHAWTGPSRCRAAPRASTRPRSAPCATSRRPTSVASPPRSGGRPLPRRQRRQGRRAQALDDHRPRHLDLLRQGRRATSASSRRASRSWSPAARRTAASSSSSRAVSRWVTAGLPQPRTSRSTAAAGLSMEPCPDGSVESGLTDNAVYVYRSVCHAFPQITTYGGWDNHGEHASGRALDIMVSDVQLGTAIAEFLRVPRRRAAPLRHPLASAHLDAGPRRPRAGGRCRAAARRRPTTTTTCTSRRTDPLDPVRSGPDGGAGSALHPQSSGSRLGLAPEPVG